jgi:hypothetical protein
MKQFAILIATALMLTACSKSSEHQDSLAAHNTAEKVKEVWVKQTKPIEIQVVDRTKEELQAIGKIGVWLNNDEIPTEFSFDGESFKPATEILVDSTVIVRAEYPFRANAHIGDTIRISQPLGHLMTGKVLRVNNNEEKVMIKLELKDYAALLRIRLKSDNIEDILSSIAVLNISVISDMVKYDNGVVKASVTDEAMTALINCALNNGMPHDFYFLPVEKSSDALLIINVNGKFYRVTTTIPPLRQGSITELHLVLNKGKLTVGSSWVDTKYPFEEQKKAMPDSIKVGHFLQKNGSISTAYNDESIAMVIESNGKHGRAIALKDNDGAISFGRKQFQTGQIFETVDGKSKEGCFYSKKKAEGENLIQFAPKVVYTPQSAFGERNGAGLSMKILDNCSEEARKQFEDAAGFGTAYIPSLFELASLAQELMVYADNMPKEFIMPDGYYMSSCESGAATFYALNLNEFRISAYNSKAYPNTKTRLFYLF